MSPKRIVARYKLAIEFPTEQARKKYFEEHPNADPKNHSVAEHEAETEAPKKTFKEKLKALSEKAQAFIKSAPADVKKFIEDDSHRRKILQDVHKSIEDAPKKFVDQAKKAIKKEAHEWKEASEGVSAILSGKEATKAQKKAIKTVAFDIALTVATAAVTAGAASLATAATKSFTAALCKKIALNVVKDGFGHVITLEELGHFGHGVAEMVEHVLTAAEKPKPDEALASYVTGLVAKKIKALSDEDLLEAVEDAS